MKTQNITTHARGCEPTPRSNTLKAHAKDLFLSEERDAWRGLAITLERELHRATSMQRKGGSVKSEAKAIAGRKNAAKASAAATAKRNAEKSCSP